MNRAGTHTQQEKERKEASNHCNICSFTHVLSKAGYVHMVIIIIVIIHRIIRPVQSISRSRAGSCPPNQAKPCLASRFVPTKNKPNHVS